MHQILLDYIKELKKENIDLGKKADMWDRFVEDVLKEKSKYKQAFEKVINQIDKQVIDGMLSDALNEFDTLTKAIAKIKKELSI